MEGGLDILIKGFFLGIMVAAPVGPIAVLVFSRSLQFGFLAGFSCALGVALVDGLFAAVAGFGITFISDFLLAYQGLIKILGGGFLVFLGAKTLLRQKISQTLNKEVNLGQGFLKGLTLTTAMTLTNPLTIVLFISLFGTAGFKTVQEGYWPVALLVAGVFFGTLSWKTGLSFVGHLGRKKLQPSHLVGLNWISGLILIGFGCFFVLNTLGKAF